ncbi:MAG TPA: hypothetical protein VNW51_06640 [Mucilaginibacter sp.]|jgi:hypothetical protein|nr:hypothetical protein [Mucilaginibacter sp.]
MKKIHFNVLLIAISVFSFSFCKKGEHVEQSANASIYNTGPIALDGCGWVIRIDSTKEYSPVNLDTAYMHSGLKVNISYRLLSTKYQCGSIAGFGMQQIQISSMSKK